VTHSRRSVVDFVVPAGIDDPERVSGGNVFDQQLRDGLSRLGWEVRMHEIDVDAGPLAEPSYSSLLDDAVVLIDGLVATRWPAAVEADAHRLRFVVIAHMVSGAFADADSRTVQAERRMLRASRGVIATSEWTRAELLKESGLPSGRVVVVTPGTEDAREATGTPTGCGLLCVGVVAPHKGQDTLIEALARLGRDAPWTCTIAGSVAVHPSFADRVARLAVDNGLDDRVRMAGILSGEQLAAAYQSTDLLVAPSRTESYGMAITDALRRGIPVVASSVGGIPQTVASRAAVLVPPGEPRALSDTLRRWMLDSGLRARLRDEARRGRSLLPSWSDAAESVAATLAGMP